MALDILEELEYRLYKQAFWSSLCLLVFCIAFLSCCERCHLLLFVFPSSDTTITNFVSLVYMLA